MSKAGGPHDARHAAAWIWIRLDRCRAVGRAAALNVLSRDSEFELAGSRCQFYWPTPMFAASAREVPRLHRASESVPSIDKLPVVDTSAGRISDLIQDTLETNAVFLFSAS